MYNIGTNENLKRMTDRIVVFSEVMEGLNSMITDVKQQMEQDPDGVVDVVGIINEVQSAVDVYTDSHRSFFDGAGREHILSSDTLYCSACDLELPKSDFSLNKSTKSGYQGWCKRCICERNHKGEV